MLEQHPYLLEQIKEKRSRHPHPLFIIAIDGYCGSGKSTLAGDLAREFSCDLIHLDDFFLPKALRTEKRLRETAGNFHYERFEEEVLSQLKAHDLTYKIFNCKNMDYAGEKTVELNGTLVIEGSYLFSHDFSEYYDLKLFLHCNQKTQLDNLLKRVGPHRLEQFTHKWIPMENRYFDTCNPKKLADILIDTSK